MRKLFVAFAGVSLLALGACTSASPSIDASLDTAYIAAVNAEIAYETLPTAKPAVVKQIEAYRVAAYADLQPVDAAAQSGQSIDYAVASAALATLANYLTAQGVTK